MHAKSNKTIVIYPMKLSMLKLKTTQELRTRTKFPTSNQYTITTATARIYGF